MQFLNYSHKTYSH